MKLNRLAIAVAAVLAAATATAHAAVPLPGMNPVVSSQVSASAYKYYTVNLWGEGDSFTGYKWTDSDYSYTTQRGQAVSFGRDFSQYDGSKVYMGAYANSNFKVNKVAASMLGAAPAPVHTEYGSMQANQSYWDNYIQKNYWYSGSDYEQVFESPNIGGVDRVINVPSGTTYEEDSDGYVKFGHRDADDKWVADTRVVASYGGQNEYWDNYLVAATMPEVEIDGTPNRSVSAHSKWENIFFFDNQAKNGTTGTATFKLHLTGDYSGESGYFRYMARDWEHKDSGSYLKYEEVYLDGTDGHLDKYLTVAVNFQYGTAQYVKSEAEAQLWGEGDLDFSHSVEVVEVEVPEGTAVYSYASYLTGEGLGFNVAGGVDGDTLPGGAGGYFGTGGGGGVNPPVPEPETYAMMLAGLALVGWSARRRRSA